MKVLFCGAHPDDAEIFVFGTLFAYRSVQAEVVLVMATNGEGGAARRSPDQPLGVTRGGEARASAALLGARLIALDLPDGGLSVARLALADRLDRLFDLEQPDLIITHSAHDYHPDHRALSCAVAVAAVDRCPLLYADTMKGALFHPTHYVDISAFQDAKFACLRLHHSQMPRRYVLMALALARQRGVEATGSASAVMEAFRFDPHPKFNMARLILPPNTLQRPAALPAYSPLDR